VLATTTSATIVSNNKQNHSQNGKQFKHWHLRINETLTRGFVHLTKAINASQISTPVADQQLTDKQIILGNTAGGSRAVAAGLP
jgi:hypothetical protein